MDKKKMLNNEELEKVIGGYTHDTETISNAVYRAWNKFGELRYREQNSIQSSGVLEPMKYSTN